MNNIINFVPEIKPSFVTIFHELMHLVQHANPKMPKTEEFCSISAMARVPKELMDDDIIPYITYYSLKLRGELAEFCREAIKYRDNGGRDYLDYLRNELEKAEERGVLHLKKKFLSEFVCKNNF
jgi:hypothetical protein